MNRVRLPIVLMVSWMGKMNILLSLFAPENLVARDGFRRPVLRQTGHFHTQAESGVFTHGTPPDSRGGVLLYIPHSMASAPS